jgi:hypothetical protein
MRKLPVSLTTLAISGLGPMMEVRCPMALKMG